MNRSNNEDNTSSNSSSTETTVSMPVTKETSVQSKVINDQTSQKPLHVSFDFLVLFINIL